MHSECQVSSLYCKDFFTSRGDFFMHVLGFVAVMSPIFKGILCNDQSKVQSSSKVACIKYRATHKLRDILWVLRKDGHIWIQPVESWERVRREATMPFCDLSTACPMALSPFNFPLAGFSQHRSRQIAQGALINYSS